MSSQIFIDNLVLDFFVHGTETIVHDRKANVQPLSNSFSSTDCSEYIRQTVLSWKRQLSRPMNVDLYIFNSVVNSHVLMERWNFTYTNTHDSSEINSSTNVSQRIQVLMRTLYSFLRLLPGFNLLRCSSVKPLLTLQIYDPKISPESFHYDSSNYSFPTISTSKGTLSMSVRFTSPGVIKDILTAINGGPLMGLPSPSATKFDRSDVKQHSASIPIPGRGSPVDAYRPRIMSDSSRETSRRSFKDDGSLLAVLRNEHAQAKSLDNRNIVDLAAVFASSVGSSGPSKSGGGGLLYSANIGGSGDVHYGSSPSSHSGKFLQYGQSQASSLPTNISFQPSTPGGFSSHLQGTDIVGSANLDFPRASPPFHQISASLSSNSPHVGPSQLTMLMERRFSWKKNGNAAQLNQLSTSLRTEALLHAAEQELSKMKLALPPSPFLPVTQEASAIENDDSSGKTKESDATVFDGPVASNTIGVQGISLMQTTAALHGDANPEVDNMVQAVAKLTYDSSSNRLDIVARYEKDRERRNSEIYLYDSYSNSRTVSISETTRDRDDDVLDAAQIDDDTPFATFRPSFSSAVTPAALPPGSLPFTSSSAAVAPVLAILSRNYGGNSGSVVSTGGKGAGLGGTADGLGNSGVPLPILVHDLQRSVQDSKTFLNQYVTTKGISLPVVTSAPISRGASIKFS